MSQAGVSRPGTQMSFSGGRGGGGGMLTLPEISHPLSRLGSPEKLDVRGISRSGSDRMIPAHGSGRPLSQEPGMAASRRFRSGGRSSRVSQSDPNPSFRYPGIPEGVAVVQGDPNKPRMPLFGSRAGLGSREGLQSRLSNASSQARLEIDELEAILKQRVKSNHYEIKKRFKDNDPEQLGNVSKEALLRIVTLTLGKEVTQGQFSRLMTRMGLHDKNVVSINEFFTALGDRGVTPEEIPKWVDPIQRQWQDKTAMTAAQVHMHLKEKAKQRVQNIMDLVPQAKPDGGGNVSKAEFRNTLNTMGFNMDDNEFSKLWNRYDTTGTGLVNGVEMMRQLGVELSPNGNGPECEREEHRETGSGRALKRTELQRQQMLDVERWLKNKFREGFSNMKTSFQEEDPNKTGEVSFDTFLQVLRSNNLKLEKSYLSDFLARCRVTPSKTGVPYREFLHRFQDRSDEGMAHHILTNAHHKYNRSTSPTNKSTLSTLEAQLLNMFQSDFLALLGMFHKIDFGGTDRISQEEFRAAIESRFGFDMTDEQFSLFMDRVPLDDEGLVKYPDFMSQFDTQGKAKSLFADQSQYGAKPYKPIGALPADPSPVPAPHAEAKKEKPYKPPGPLPHDPTPTPGPGAEQKAEGEDINDYMVEVGPRRKPAEIYAIIKDLLKKNYQAVEDTFQNQDELNTGRLSKEGMFKLLKSFPIEPIITRGEISDLWKTFITNSDNTLDFLQFTRHFGYSLKSASFPNAKVCPPRMGDSDFMMRSRKLNSAADMLMDQLRSKIEYRLDDIGREFSAMDVYQTGCVSVDEFRALLNEMCVHLSDYEQNILVEKFRVPDGRVSYVEFMKPFVMKRQVWRHGNNMLSLLQHPQAAVPLPGIPPSPQHGLTSTTAKLRQQLSSDWRGLRKSFKRLDTGNTGMVSLKEFRSVLEMCNVVMDEEDWFQLMSHFDKELTGKIPYNSFVNETVKPSAMSRGGPSRASTVSTMT